MANLTKNDNWGNFIPEGESSYRPATGEEVQNFIKSEFDRIEGIKPGYFSTIDEESYSILLGFKDIQSYDEWLRVSNDVNDKNYIITSTNINKGKPSAYDAVSIENKMPSNKIISTNNNVVIKIKFNSTHYTPSGYDLIPEPTNEEGELIIEKRNRKTDSWSNIYNDTIQSGEDVNINLSNELSDGFQYVRIMVTGNTTKESTTWLEFEVTKTILSLTFETNWAEPQTRGYMELGYRISGGVEKTLNVEISGVGGDNPRTITRTFAADEVFTESTYLLRIEDDEYTSYKVNTQGIHNVKSWIDAKVDGVVVATSNEILSQILVINNASLVTTPYIILNNINTSLTNWTKQNLFEYSVYHPTMLHVPIKVTMGDYDGKVEYISFTENVQKGEIKQYSNVIEINSNNDPIYAQIRITYENEDLIEPIAITVLNSGGYSPTANASFILNPRSMSNNVDDVRAIINSADNSLVESIWSGDSVAGNNPYFVNSKPFTFNNDGWVEDTEGNKCLSVLGGQVIMIKYNPYYEWTNNSCTIEMSMAVNNIVDENIPIIRMCKYDDVNNIYSDGFEGWEMKPLKGVFKTQGKTQTLEQDIAIQENSIVHIAINIMHNIYTNINLVRIFINGVINREFEYTESTLSDTQSDSRYIVIGDPLAKADVNIYTMRIYKKMVESTGILQNYISSLPTIEEKEKVKNMNNIMTGGKINYDLAKTIYNTLLWKYNEQDTETAMADYLNGKDGAKFKGDLVINIFDENGNIDKEHSGVINNMTTKGQGTSSMNYWKWNQRWEFKEYDESDYNKGYRNSVFTPLSLSENYNLTENYSWETNEDGEVELKNNSIWTKKPDANPELVETIEDKRTASWQPAPGEPYAKRLDGKINWASPMQSHKMGSVNLYNDLWKAIVKNNEITSVGATPNGVKFTGTEDGYKSCRVSIIQKPFLVFVQKTQQDSPEFYGLYTMGPSKGDKPTFGYNKKDFPNFVMMEGCDNTAHLVRCIVPWNNEDVTIPIFNDDGDMVGEKYTYKNNLGSWEVSMGSTDQEKVQLDPNGTGYDSSKTNPVLLKFKDMNNFCYKTHPHLNYFEGNYLDLLLSNNDNEKIFYWTTSGGSQTQNIPENLMGIYDRSKDNKYNLYRYDIVLKHWVHAGIEHEGNNYEVFNLVDQTGYTPTTGTLAQKNQNFINKRVELFKNGIGEYVDLDDLRYSMQFLKLIAASDNWAKNTYIYNAGVLDDNGNVVSKFRFFQDDLDTILSLNNTGYKVKPYYVEEHDLDEKGGSYWNADDNALYCNAELAWPTELRDMMAKILNTMTEIGGSVLGCFDKYYKSITDYFPQVAYNEIAKLLYEDAYVKMKDDIYTSSVPPLPQCVGDQAQGEREWLKKRGIYLASYAQQGYFNAGDGAQRSGMDGALVFRSSKVDGSNPKYKFTFKPSMWLYPSMGSGQSSVMPVGSPSNTYPPRIPAGQPVNFEFTSDGETNVCLRGIDYYSNIGDLGNASVSNNNTFQFTGARLEEIIVENAEHIDYDKIVFRPGQIGVSGVMPAVKKIVINGPILGNLNIASGSLDLYDANAKLVRMPKIEYIDVRSTSLTNISLQENSNLTHLYLPKTIKVLDLNSHKLLETLEITDYKNINTVKIKGCPYVNERNIFNELRISGAKLNVLEFIDINWTNVTLAELNYLLSIQSPSITGVITMAEDVDIDFDTKMRMLDKFGNIDDTDNQLHIIYNIKAVNESVISIKGYSYIRDTGIYQFSMNYPADNGEGQANDLVKVEWSIDNDIFGNINAKTGVFNYNNKQQNITDEELRVVNILCKIKYMFYGGIREVNVSKPIYLYEKLAEIGDLVYADGTYSNGNDYMGDKTIVGMCVLVDGSNDVKTQKRVAMAISPMCNESGRKKVHWGLDKTYEISGFSSNTPLKDITSTGTSSGYQVKMNEISEAMQSPDNSKAENTSIHNVGWTIDGLSYGEYYTQTIINLRNNILRSKSWSIPEEAIAVIENKLTELQYLDEQTSNSTSIQRGLAYYPAFSYCYAYEPVINDGEILNDKFKKHKWFLPSQGELLRILYYTYMKRIPGTETKLDGFEYFDPKSTRSYLVHSSSECANDYCGTVQFVFGNNPSASTSVFLGSGTGYQLSGDIDDVYSSTQGGKKYDLNTPKSIIPCVRF